MSDSNLEIERKVLIFNKSWKEKVEVSNSFKIEQGYLSESPVVRIRTKDDITGYLTIKTYNNEYSSNEFEYEIPINEAKKLLESCPKVLSKTRNIVYENDFMFEVDEFHGFLEGFVMAEVELKNIDDIKEFPSWMDLEVTGDKTFSNVKLINMKDVSFLDKYKEQHKSMRGAKLGIKVFK